MNADLVTMVFDERETAQTVFISLQAMRYSQVLGLDDAAIVTKDSAGQVRVYSESGASKGLAGLLGDLIFRSQHGGVRDGARANVDDEFVGLVRAALKSNGSALLFYLHPDSLSDRVELLKTLEMFRGTIHQTTLSLQSEVQLRAML